MFESVVLNPEGIRRAAVIRKAFTTLLRTLDLLVPEGREFSLAKTKLEEASFFAVRGMALDQSNQVSPTEKKVTWAEPAGWYDSYFKGDSRLPVGDTEERQRSTAPTDGHAPVMCLGSGSLANAEYTHSPFRSS